MTFRETLDQHLQTIKDRDLRALGYTVPSDRVLLIRADGRVVETMPRFMELYEDWFDRARPSLDTEVVNVIETPDLGVAVVRLSYQDDSEDGRPVAESSHLSLVFQRRENKWNLVQEQNTPIRNVAPASWPT
jgi:ketosteroid isomerase-like protein